MLIRSILFVVVSGLLSTGLWYFIEQNYPFVQASKEAEESLEVTEEQDAEMQSARLASDAVTFGLMGALFAAVTGGFASRKVGGTKMWLALGLGLVVGGVAGALTAYIGHWFDDAIPYPRDPMLYWFGRWALMLLPIAIAVGVAAAAAGNFAKDALDAIVAAVIGAGVATIAYCLLVGAVTDQEIHTYIYPGQASNRLMIILLSGVVIGGVAIIQLGRRTVNSPASDAKDAAAGDVPT